MNFDPWRLPEDRDVALVEDWDADHFELNAPPLWRFEGRIHVEAMLRRENAVVRVRVIVAAVLQAGCGRCGEMFKAGYRRRLKMRYPLETPGCEIALGEDIRAEIILSFPQKILCSDSCKGLCDHCGVDLNKEACTCL